MKVKKVTLYSIPRTQETGAQPEFEREWNPDQINDAKSYLKAY